MSCTYCDYEWGIIPIIISYNHHHQFIIVIIQVGIWGATLWDACWSAPLWWYQLSSSSSSLKNHTTNLTYLSLNITITLSIITNGIGKAMTEHLNLSQVQHQSFKLLTCQREHLKFDFFQINNCKYICKDNILNSSWYLQVRTKKSCLLPSQTIR